MAQSWGARAPVTRRSRSKAAAMRQAQAVVAAGHWLLAVLSLRRMLGPCPSCPAVSRARVLAVAASPARPTTAARQAALTLALRVPATLCLAAQVGQATAPPLLMHQHLLMPACATGSTAQALTGPATTQPMQAMSRQLQRPTQQHQRLLRSKVPQHWPASRQARQAARLQARTVPASRLVRRHQPAQAITAPGQGPPRCAHPAQSAASLAATSTRGRGQAGSRARGRAVPRAARRRASARAPAAAGMVTAQTTTRSPTPLTTRARAQAATRHLGPQAWAGVALSAGSGPGTAQLTTMVTLGSTTRAVVAAMTGCGPRQRQPLLRA
mmetsp:Transcript_22226/g.56486  ORF Transcript_22226/g.56486 Transcript_22226/m.56486 type:complete len:326 (+) Transcript_22226:1969-2946(+)